MSKRKFEEIEQTGDDDDLSSLNPEDIEKLLSEAPQVEALTPQALRRMMLALEKKISKNQELRVKHGAEPEKYFFPQTMQMLTICFEDSWSQKSSWTKP